MPSRASTSPKASRTDSPGRVGEDSSFLTRPFPRLAPGTELFGVYQGSGLEDPPYLVRRPDGRLAQVSRLLYAVLSEMDGEQSLHDIADNAGAAAGRPIDGDDVSFLIERKLNPLGLVAGPSSAPLLQPHAPLALRVRAAFVPASVVRTFAALFTPLFHPAVMVAVIAGLVAVDLWLGLVHGISTGVHQVIAEPILALLLFGLTVVGALFHEWGHAAACRYSGGRPGAIGAGLYIVWPAFYTDVT